MYKNEEDKLTDIMLGEAVLALLHGGGPVTNAALIDQLRTMIDVEQDEIKKRACKRAINEVRESKNNTRTTHEVRDRDNVRHIFNNDGPSDDTKKH
ncbi:MULTISPECIES: hypothetical protein [Erwinia]|uniref:hypothetical protein n=1 Tax=Erwinia TaxID=551 RepID=UPI00055165A0|nr:MULTISPECIES: hypothetical protein [Erwinia]